MLPESFHDINDAVGSYAQVVSEKAKQSLLVERVRTQVMVETAKNKDFQKEVKGEVYKSMLKEFGVKKAKDDYIIDFSDEAEATPVAEGEV